MLTPGTSVGRYVVQRKLAEGGMAEIYLASAVGAEGFSKDVVIKVVRSFLASDQQFVQMFIAEARLASRLNHANVVQIFDFGKHEETYYLAMEYVRGASLWDLRKRCREFGVPFPPTLAAEIGAQVARGLQYAHSLSEGGQKLGVVHRDVTPHNVLLSFDGAVKLTDFGIAKATTSQTAPGMLKGKFAYMSPEQARGDRVDARTDVFALGIVLWELLTGGRLFDGDSDVAVLRSVQESFIAPPARLNPDVAGDLSDIVMKALARVTDERFNSAFELEKALATWVLRNANSVDDTSVSTFLQHMFREEFEHTPSPVPQPASSPMPADDFGVGSTMFVDRSKPTAKPVMPTMTGTPVMRAPARATPMPTDRRSLDSPNDPGDPAPRRTEQMPGLSASARLAVKTTPMAPAARQGTEQQPAFKPGPISRRFDPLPIQEPSVVQPVVPVETTSKSQSQTEPADEVFAPPARSKAPFIVIGVALLGMVGGVGAMALKGDTNQPQVVEDTTPPSTAPSTPAQPVEPPAPVARVEKPAEAPVPVVIDAGAETVPAVAAAEAAPRDAGRPPTPTVAVARKREEFGTLAVRALPFAIVLANGRELGEVTGSHSFRIAPRTYEIEFVKGTRHEKKTVTVKANEITQVDFDGR